MTNQGTDVHLQDAAVDAVTADSAYRVTGDVVDAPETREGGHVFVTLEGDDTTLDCAAFEPTKGFRDRVRSLRVGDRITACGEVTDGTLKLEKFAVRELVRTEPVTPDCPDCGRSMKSAGRNQAIGVGTAGPAPTARSSSQSSGDWNAAGTKCRRLHAATSRSRWSVAGSTRPLTRPAETD